MSMLLAGCAGVLLVAGVLLGIAGFRKVPIQPSAPARRRGRWGQISRRTKIVAAVATALGVVAMLVSGWAIAVVAFPVAAVGLPWLLGKTGEGRVLARLDGLAEWTRNLAGVIRVGAGLERALIDTLHSTPAVIRPEVSALVARLRAKWGTEEAIRMFATEFDDATGDLVAAALVLAVRTRADGLAAILDSLAQTVSAEVSTRRQLEADRAKPAQSVRIITFVTVGLLAVLSMSGSYMEPYRASATGQLVLGGLLASFVGLLVLIKRMSTPKPLPRFFASTEVVG